MEAMINLCNTRADVRVVGASCVRSISKKQTLFPTDGTISCMGH